MFESGQFLYEDVKSKTPFLNEDGLCIADHFFGWQWRHEASGPAGDEGRSDMIEITVSLLSCKLPFLIGAIEVIDSV
jgi:hypothetical protein